MTRVSGDLVWLDKANGRKGMQYLSSTKQIWHRLVVGILMKMAKSNGEKATTPANQENALTVDAWLEKVRKVIKMRIQNIAKIVVDFIKMMEERWLDRM